jgi:predicted Ser/Thr protein kinase
MKVQDRTPERLGPYRLIRRLGEGGMGVVYLAADASEQLVAVKALHPGLAAEDNAKRRLAREVETMHRVRSPHVAEVIGADLSDDPPYIVTRYVPGLTLDAIVGANGRLTGAALARLVHGLANALSAVHAAGVVHRDLKPGNVMIADGEPVVIDFGIAQVPETTRLTVTGMFMGTPGYLAPEVIEGKDAGPASDVHSWGATVAYAATGRPPFGTGTFETVFFRIMHGQADLDTIPVALQSMVQRALARDPAARPTAAELAQWSARLDPVVLIPSPPARVAAELLPGVAGVAGVAAAPQATVTDQPGASAWPATAPLAVGSADDVRELLPPVAYGPGQPGNGQLAGGGQAGPSGLAVTGAPWNGGAAPDAIQAGMSRDGRAAGHGLPSRGEAAAAPRQAVAPVTAWSPLVLACVAVLVGLSVYAPLMGTAFALAVLVALRAASVTGRQLARRRSADASTSVRSLVAVALYPVALLRSALLLLSLIPIALLGFAVVASITIILVQQHPLPQAVAYGAGALVAVVGLGPGSGGSRSVLARALSSVARTPSRMAVAYVGVFALALWAALTAWSQPAVFWPLANAHNQLMHMPTVHSTLNDIRLSLLKLARRLGL